MNTTMGARPWLARTQSEYAQTLLACTGGDSERAHELRDAARTIYCELGMDSYAAEATLRPRGINSL
jgi:hypothetical protein